MQFGDILHGQQKVRNDLLGGGDAKVLPAECAFTIKINKSQSKQWNASAITSRWNSAFRQTQVTDRFICIWMPAAVFSCRWVQME